MDLIMSERRIREAREKREQETRADDRRTRERLERSSPDGSRLGFVDFLNGMSRDQAAAAMPGLDAIESVRKRQALGRRTAEEHNRSYEAFEKARGVHAAPSGFNFEPSDPGNLPGEKIRDAAGSLRGRDGGPGGEVHGVDAAFLLDVARQLIEAVRSRAYPQHKV